MDCLYGSPQIDISYRAVRSSSRRHQLVDCRNQSIYLVDKLAGKSKVRQLAAVFRHVPSSGRALHVTAHHYVSILERVERLVVY